jgi:ABC-type antimicrobial peptide transport system permease subunit
MFAEALESYGIGAIMYPRLGPDDALWPALLAAVTAVVAGLWPAIRVARLRPAEALRHH